MKKLAEIFTADFRHWDRIDFFRRVLYVFLFINTLTLLPIAWEIWSYNGITGTRGYHSVGSYTVLNVLSHPKNSSWEWVYIVFVIGQLTFLVTGFLNKWPRISAILVYFFTVNLFLKGSIMFTGGEVLANFLLFYMIFIHKPREGSKYSFFQNVLNNTFYRIILIQICVCYFYSFWYKLYDENWLSGEAMMYVARVDHFSSSLMRWLFAENESLSLIATYITLLYQGAFPLVIWFKKLKAPVLILGVLIHLGISFLMGLFAFGVIMILCYLLFVEDRHLNWMRAKVSFKRSEDSA
ncbi:hypothetical protein JYT72_01170 [Crocinitomix catalasitica]|nr:hypothetical protein [Crocinitomix catalasitica]